MSTIPMIDRTLLARLRAAGVRLRRQGAELGVSAGGRKLDAALVAELRAHKSELLELIGDAEGWWLPPAYITPEMLPLIDLTQEQVDRIVETVDGGAANVQDIYPLAPLQEGILFHHRLTKGGDAYLLPSMLRFDSRERLDDYLRALQAVTDRHDILRTAFVWEGLTEPAQVVWRKARIPSEELTLDPANGDVVAQLYERFDRRHTRMDVTRAPLMRTVFAHDAADGKWVLLIIRHHLIGDHTTVDIRHEEVQAHLLGREARLPAPLPFRNFVAQARLGMSKEEHEAFFRELLGDVDEPTAPFGVLDVRSDGFATEEAQVEVEDEVARRLRELARRLGVTTATLFHLAWALVLARVSGRDDVVFGTILFGRMQGGEGADRAMGLFINTLPIRMRMGDESVATAARRMHVLLAELMRHEHASLALAQRCSAVPAPRPLFTSLLNYRHSPRMARELTGEAAIAFAGMEPILSEERTNYPLAVSVDDMGDRFRITVQSQESIDAMRVCAFMSTAASALARVPEHTALHGIDVLPVEERQRVTVDFNATDSEVAEATIHELIEAQAARTPDAVAVMYGNESLTYAQLNARANRLAHYLRERGVGADARVAISMPRSLDLMVSLLAIAKAGGAYVPLDPAYPADRLRAIVEDSEPVVVLDSLASIDLDGRPETNLEPNVTADNLAYVIYTSGSTGKPKGVMLEHRGLVNHTRWQIATFGIDANDTILQRTSINFDASVWELWTPLAAGARLLLLPAEAGRDPEAIARVLENNPITIAQFVPALLQAVLHAMKKPLPCRILFCGGEALPASLIREARAKGARSVVNLYGPTEATVDSTYMVCGDEEPVSIGRPVTNTRVYILDAQGRPVPVGVAGEIHVAGVQVARGYVKLPSDRFTTDPFRGGRMYRTGDAGRWLSDGTIEFLGRGDQQVKLRGFRIELGEIETKLLEVAREAVVVVSDDRLVAYCVGDAAIETLREHVAASLPEYMVPSAYVRLEALPLLPNGKVDRKALPAPDADATVRRGFEEPRGEIETAVAEVWTEVLRTDRVSRDDNFFERGGHSLLAVLLIDRLRQRNLHAEVTDLFEAPTLADLAARISDQSNAVQVPANAIPADAQAITPGMLPLVKLAQNEIDAIVARVEGGAANVQDIYPLAPLQEGIFFHHLLGQAGDTYLLSTLFAFDNRERVDAFARALQAVIDRHDILRTSIAWEGLHEPVQVVRRKVALPVEEVVLDPAAGDLAAQLYERFDPRCYRIDVAQAPWVRVCVAHDAARERWLVVMLLHHLAGDHTTLDVLQHEIAAHLSGEQDQLPAALPFRNFVAQARLGMPSEAHETFFRKMLGNVDEPTAPFGLVEVQGEGSRIHEVRKEVDPLLARRIRERARKLGVSAASLFHLAWGAVLGRVCGRGDVVFGTVLFGRMEGGEGADRVMGLFINTLPVRIELGEEEVRSSVKRTHALLTDLLRHEHASLAMAQRCSSVAAPAPLFSSLLNYRHSGHPAERQGRGSWAWEGITGIYGQERTNYPLTLSIDDRGEGFALTAQVQEPVEPKRVCTFMHTALERLVTALEERPSAAVKTIDILPAGERSLVVNAFNTTAMNYPAEALMHELFEEQVARTPDAIALVHGEESLTYRELNRRANRLARHLRTLGVGPDARVGICLDRGPRMLVSMLGVLKAGGAYVPLDPAYPADRLQFMTEDSEPVVVIDRAFSFDESSCEDGDLQRNGTSSSSLAYVIYTSGSTGKPKGVAIEHRNAVNFITWAQRSFGTQELDRTLFSTSLNFDLAVFETFVPLSVGTSLRMVANAMEVAEDVTLINTVPSAIDALTEIGGVAPTVRTINLAGEPLKRAVVEKIFVTTNAERVCNLYGPSETTTYSTWVEMPRAEGFVGHIGRPVANTQIYLLDGERQPVPVGVVGEIYIGGAGVARGYLNRPELTAERFLDNPFGPGRMYRTGDLGRWLPDGNLEFLGRNDHQVKIRGFRIELGEIEARLAAHPSVKDAVVIAREERLIAYYAGEETSEKELRSHIAATLPEHMVPSLFVRLEALPLTPNGKIDRKALPAPELDGRSAEYEAPKGEVETALAEIWAEVLKLERVGRNENFFELGGHSLLAVTVIERMRRKGLHADVRALFASPTIAQLAAEAASETQQIEVPANVIPLNAETITPEMLPLIALEQSEIDSIVSAAPDGAANVQDIYPLAPLQEGILFHHLMDQDGDTYLLSSLLSFDTRERLDAFTSALQSVVDRHDILRTAVMWEGLAQPVQVVCRTAALPVEEVTAESAEQLYERFNPRRYRIDIRRAPLMRLAIAKDAGGQWLMLLLLHHLAGDHTTFAVVHAEVQAFLSGAADTLPAPQPFRDFVAQARFGLTTVEHETFFRELLGDVEEPTSPFGMIDAQRERSSIREERFELDAAVEKRLRESARRLGVSVGSVCHLAFARMLARISGRDDVVFGTVLFGRMQARFAADRAMGLFINTLPMRVRIGDDGVEPALRAVHAQLGDLMRHEHASLALAQRCSAVPAPAPLFSALLNYRHGHRPAGDESQVWEGVTGIYAEERTNYPLTLSIDDLGDALRFTAQIASVDPMRLCAFVETSVRAIVGALEHAPATPLRKVDVLPAEERRQVLETFNATDAPFPAEACIHELIEEQVVRTPDAEALRFQGGSLTYAELNARANQLAHHLRGLGVRPETRVGISMERSAELVIGLLAILKAGGAYVPLDPSYPADRLRMMLDDCAPVVVLTRESFETAEWANQPRTNPERNGLTATSPAYVIYTSGSTGMPKGAINEHRGVVNRLVWMQDAYRLGSADAVLQKTPFSFDVSVWEFFWPLQVGARLVMARPDGHKDPQYLIETITSEAITTMHFVPSMLEVFVEAEGVERCTNLKRVVCSGEALPPALVRRFFERLPRTELVNLYGPTEAAVDVTAWTCTAENAAVRVPIGRPIANTSIYIIDANGDPVPVGVTGEICIGGVQVARGYLNRAELTAERFVDDPFAGMPGARMYRTGDVGRWLGDGTIEYIGRNDDQVKLRGMRIELGEIEARLAEHGGVREAVVVARQADGGEKRLVAYYVAEAPVDVEDLRAHLSARLPEYMVPAAYMWLESMPLSANGKLDRKRLPAPEASAYARAEYEAPIGEIETAVAEIWAEVLRVERVGRHDNFFELGGHSLLAITLIERMRRRGFSADIRAIFATPTLADLSASVGRETKTFEVPANLIPAGCTSLVPEMLPLVQMSQANINRIVANVPGGAANVQDIYPLVPLQEGILFHHLVSADGDAYLTPSLIAFDTRERLDAFAAALQTVVDRHDILRTAVMWEALPAPVQVVLRRAQLDVEELALDAADGDVARQLLERFNPRRTRIDVRRAPLLRAHIARDEANGRWLLLLLLHHLADDNTSLKLIFAEVQALLLDRAAQLPPPRPFRDFVAETCLGVSREEHEAFFRQLLGDVDQPTAPFGLLDVRGDGSDIDQARHELPHALSERIRARARLLGVSAATLCHLAWALVVARLSGRDDVVFGTVLFGRMQRGEGAAQAMGVFINTLPARVTVDETGVESAVRRTQALLADLMRHEHASLALAQRCSGVEAPSPLFSALLNYRHAGRANRSEQSREAWQGIEAVHSEERTNYPVTLSVDDSGEGFALTAQVQSPAEPSRLCAFMETALERLVASLETAPATPLRDVDVMPEAERQHLLHVRNATAAEFPTGVCVHELFEMQVRRQPDAPAVVIGDALLTYGELDRRANRLAHHLRALGAGPDTTVAICAERSVEMVVGLLAVLKAGGAYVPMDPTYPADRLGYMTEDSGAIALLTHASLRERFDVAAIPVVDLASDFDQHPDASPRIDGLSPSHLAYVIYTSGSTGTPKGVAIEHRNLANLIHWHCDAFALQPGQRSSSVAGFGFDAATWEIWPVLCAGATLVLPQPGLDPEALLRWWEAEDLDVGFLPTPVAELAFTRGITNRKMRRLLVGGDRLRHFPQDEQTFTLINNYGPTETTVVATSGVVTRTGKAHIGAPIANTRIYILDERMRVAPVGVPGEMYVGGAGVARGYLNRPELTAERFLDDPFSASGSRRMYRTGDIARWLPDGTVDFVGRNDSQVKLRGFRVELGEIESRLGAHPEVREAVVVALDDEAANQRLVAYYTGAEVDAARLREHVAGHLPEYMLPAAFVRLHALPLTPNGKIDRRALPRPDADAYAPAEYQPPQGEVEQALARIWADVLRLDRIGRHDNFFVLGGHSLLAVTLIERMRQEGLNADVRALFATPTIAELAVTVGQQAAVAVPANRIPSRTDNDSKSLKVVL